MNTNAMEPFSLRFPQPLRQRIRERAEIERRSFANQVRVLLERALDASQSDPSVSADEIERLHQVYQQAIEGA
jgi:hypothetical protein